MGLQWDRHFKITNRFIFRHCNIIKPCIEQCGSATGPYLTLEPKRKKMPMRCAGCSLNKRSSGDVLHPLKLAGDYGISTLLRFCSPSLVKACSSNALPAMPCS